MSTYRYVSWTDPLLQAEVLGAIIARSKTRMPEYNQALTHCCETEIRQKERDRTTLLIYSWPELPPLPLNRGGVVTNAFLHIPMRDLRSAARFVCELPYGRNSHADDPLVVLVEHKGTCSTKHALIRRLAIEQGFDLLLILGIFGMTEGNTPGVGRVLQQYGLSTLPEAHCYLRSGPKRIDVTRPRTQEQNESIRHFWHEEEINPDQITHYKANVHKKFLGEWVTGNDGLSGRSLAEIWKIREECIASLSQ